MKFRFDCGAQLVINLRRRDDTHKRARQRQAAHAARKAKGRRLHMAQTAKRWRRTQRIRERYPTYWPALLAGKALAAAKLTLGASPTNRRWLTFDEAQALGWT